MASPLAQQAVEPSSSGPVDPATAAAARRDPGDDVTEKRARAAQTIQVGLYSRCILQDS
ncbi:hypothetical protein ABHI18_004311 [Aspergillus niger]